jgi:large subunit ribosomal protein L9
MRATKSNIAYFETQKKLLETENLKKRSEAEAVASKMGNFSVVILRQASEGGQLYGSVTTRDIAEGAAKGRCIDRSHPNLPEPVV